jgi:alcohol dehydrogenase
MVSSVRHVPSFAGEMVLGEEELPDGALVLVDAELSGPAVETGLLRTDSDVVAAHGRPNRDFVDAAIEIAAERGALEIAVIGCGALLDAAKLVSVGLAKRVDGPVPLTTVPCGAEPYRAVSGFAVVDEAGERPTVVDERFRRSRVILAPRLLAALPEEVSALHALDTAVHCVESLLSVRAHPYARLLAMSALRTVADDLNGFGPGRGAAGPRLVVAAAAAVEAFSTTRLGLAHAIASPLGTRLGVTHDALNGVLGEAVISFWGEDVRGLPDVAAGFGVERSQQAVLDVLARLRQRAGLPGSLEAMGIGWESVEAILPRAARSSGIAALPGSVDAPSIESFAARAWAGGVSQEEVGSRGVG